MTVYEGVATQGTGIFKVLPYDGEASHHRSLSPNIRAAAVTLITPNYSKSISNALDGSFTDVVGIYQPTNSACISPRTDV